GIGDWGLGMRRAFFSNTGIGSRKYTNNFVELLINHSDRLRYRVTFENWYERSQEIAAIKHY
ncbi:hypothetical protein, partial [Merismopedia glauca]|uniref:hypothetical protein n=1 Tax=Merismopedia glauca TaxID=292586 RepID=UPI001C627666